MTTKPSVREPSLPPSARATHSTPAGPGYLLSPVPHDLLSGAHAAHRRVLDLAGRLTDDLVARPSLLPGWTVGHVLTHLARHADGHRRVFEAAAAGLPPVPPYPNGPAGRAEAITAGAGRPAAELASDLAQAVGQLERAWDTAHVDVWRTGLGLHGDHQLVSVADLVFLRWREAAVHAVDLGLADRDGPAWSDLPAPYVDAEWAWTTGRLVERVPPEVTVLLAPGDRPSRAYGHGPRLVTVRAMTDETLRWLTGRLPTAAVPADWPALAPWERPAVSRPAQGTRE